MGALSLTNPRICVLGLGYVGLPLAVAFGVHHDTVGYDLDAGRIAELRQGRDRTLEVEPEALADRSIVTVPTPIDGPRRPDLTAISAYCCIRPMVGSVPRRTTL